MFIVHEWGVISVTKINKGQGQLEVSTAFPATIDFDVTEGFHQSFSMFILHYITSHGPHLFEVPSEVT